VITKNPFEKRSYFLTVNKDNCLEILNWLRDSGITYQWGNGQIWFKTDEDELLFVLRWANGAVTG